MGENNKKITISYPEAKGKLKYCEKTHAKYKEIPIGELLHWPNN